MHHRLHIHIYLLYALLCVAFACGEVCAQCPDSCRLRAGFSLGILNQHHWRGTLISRSPCLEPDFTLSAGKLTFTAWGGYSLDTRFTEIDFIASFSPGKFTFTLYDYYIPDYAKPNSFFRFSGDSALHTLDAAVDFRPAKRIEVGWATMFFGDDRSEDNRQLYSTYVWLRLKAVATSGVSGEFLVGATPWAGYYAPKPAFVDCGFTCTADYHLGSLLLSNRLKILLNPYREDLYFIYGLYLVF